MAKGVDILLDENFELLIRNGGFVNGPSLDQEVMSILKANKTSYKQDILVGCDLVQDIRTSNTARIRSKVQLQLQRDRKNVKSITIKNGEIIPDVTER